MSFQVGDRVQCTHDAAAAKAMASGHGGWVSSMRTCVGKVGTVEQVDSDGDIKVDCSGGRRRCDGERATGRAAERGRAARVHGVRCRGRRCGRRRGGEGE